MQKWWGYRKVSPPSFYTMNIETYRAAHDLAEEGNWMQAAALLIPESQWGRLTSNESAKQTMMTIFYSLLASGDLESASALAWSKYQFSLRPQSAKRIWELYDECRMLLVMGGGSVGKSYTLATKTLLDWCRDPEHTLVRVISVTSGHAKLNIFGQIQELHKTSLIPLPGMVGAEKISTDAATDISGIHLVAIPQGDQGKGRIRGIHPKPRSKPHPVFGILSRTRVLLDEAEEIPGAIWEDLANAILTLEDDDVERIKILGASNPKDPSSEFGKRCEPKGGWRYDSDEDEWESVRGWSVYRIDGAKTENVANKKMMPGCEGLMTYAGYQAAIANAGGEGTPEYYTMCRGMFPPAGHQNSIIPRHLLDECRGEWIFEDLTIDVFGVDSSLSGGDATILTYGRFGPARKMRKRNNEEVEVHDSVRMCLQIDHQINIVSEHGSMSVARAIMRELPSNINPEFLAVDSTGTADGCASSLQDSLGDILHVVASEAPSDQPVMAEDEKIAKDIFTNKRSELWYGFRGWVDAGLVAISDACEEELIKELSTVRGDLSGKKYRVERKDRFKLRNKSKSPDRADSAILLVYLLRLRSDIVTGFITSQKRYNDIAKMDWKSETAYGSEVEFIDSIRD